MKYKTLGQPATSSAPIKIWRAHDDHAQILLLDIRLAVHVVTDASVGIRELRTSTRSLRKVQHLYRVELNNVPSAHMPNYNDILFDRLDVYLIYTRPLITAPH